MNANLRLVLGIALLFGISTGAYEFALPLLLDKQGISYSKMGLIFALAGVGMVLARVYMGGLADRCGRKGLYGWAIGVCGLAVILTPMSVVLVWQILLKTLRETAALTRETLHPIILYEESNAGFLNRISKFRGVELLFQAGGTMLVIVIISHMGGGVQAFQTALYVSGSFLVLGALLWAWRFRERFRPTAQRIVTLREMLNFDLHPNLRIILVSCIIFNFGLMISHSFYMNLFFRDRFGIDDSWAGGAMVLHRLTLALPLLIVGNLRLKNLRAWYIFGLLVQGIITGVSAILPTFFLSAGVFLLHDFIGAGIWSPIQATLIQRYSRDETRGLEVGKVLAWGSIGAILGPLVAGPLGDLNVVLPFIVSGIFMALAAIPIFWINHHAPAPMAARVAEPVA